MRRLGIIIRKPLLAILATIWMLLPANAQGNTDVTQFLKNIIIQLQIGTPERANYSDLLWQTIFEQTGGRGFYPVLVNLGPPVKVDSLRSTQLPTGVLHNFVVQHPNGITVWTLGFRAGSEKLEFANFKVQNLNLPANRELPNAPLGRSNSDEPAAACKQYPSLCQ